MSAITDRDIEAIGMAARAAYEGAAVAESSAVADWLNRIANGMFDEAARLDGWDS